MGTNAWDTISRPRNSKPEECEHPLAYAADMECLVHTPWRPLTSDRTRSGVVKEKVRSGRVTLLGADLAY